MTYQDKLTEILRRARAYDEARCADLPPSDDSLNPENAQAAINALNQETLGEDEHMYDQRAVSVLTRNNLRADLRKRFGVNDAR